MKRLFNPTYGIAAAALLCSCVEDSDSNTDISSSGTALVSSSTSEAVSSSSTDTTATIPSSSSETDTTLTSSSSTLCKPPYPGVAGIILPGCTAPLSSLGGTVATASSSALVASSSSLSSSSLASSSSGTSVISGTFVDPRDSIPYSTVQKAGLVWMTQDLSHQPDTIPQGDTLIGYGFYTYRLAAQACPSPWRLPTETEFTALLQSTSTTSQGLAVQGLCVEGWGMCDNSQKFNVYPYGLYTFATTWQQIESFTSANYWLAESSHYYKLMQSSYSVDSSTTSAIKIRCVQDL